MRLVAFQREPPLSLPVNRLPSLFLDNMNYLSTLSKNMNQAIYDPNQMYRAAENEFWFNGNPLLALIAILILK